MSFLESTESVKFVKYFCNKGAFEPATFCVTNQDATITERIFKMNLIHASVISQIF